MARRLLVLGLATLCAAALGPTGPPAGDTPAPVAAGPTGTAPAGGADGAGRPAPVLREGTARQAGLLPEHLDRAVAEAAAGLAPQPTTGRPLYPGAVVLAARHGVVATRVAMGHALRYADAAPTELPADQRLPMRTDTVFDLASLSKLFTSIVAVQQVERGRLDLDATVAGYLPAFAANGKGAVTVRQLLTHTSGLPSWLPLWQLPDDAARLAATYGVVPRAAPGTAYLYSDLNLITLGEIVELVAGAPLDEVVRTGITAPLGLTDTGYTPPVSLRPRIAATEFQSQPPRGLVHGSVHDENAWSFGGVAGHAGVFSTARDLAVLCQTILNGGAYGRARILSRDATEQLLTNLNTAFPANSHGLGFELYQYGYMGALASPYTAGHTGFTGTTLTIDRTSGTFLLVLTNRVHPSRDWGSIQPRRRAVADAVARAVPVRPQRGRTAWFSGMGHARTATLTLPVPTGGTRLDFGLWYDTEPADTVTLESSVDGGTTWTPLPHRLDGSAVDTGAVSGWGGRRWRAGTADLPAGDLLVRWRYATDADLQGRGAYVDAVRVRAGHRPLFDDARPADAARLRLDGFTASAD